MPCRLPVYLCDYVVTIYQCHVNYIVDSSQYVLYTCACVFMVIVLISHRFNAMSTLVFVDSSHDVSM